MQLSADSPAQVADTEKLCSNMTECPIGVGLDRMASVDVIIYSGCITLMCSLIFPGWVSHQDTVFCDVT